MARFNFLFPQARAIIFDLGGVLFDIDYQLTQKAFEAVGLKSSTPLYSQAKQISLFDELETGRISPSEFRNEIRKLIPDKILSDTQIDEAWCAMLLGMPIENFSLLLDLKKTYRTFLLSNTNIIHLEKVFACLPQNFGIDSFDSFFEKAYYSSSIGLRKPDIEVFEFVLKENNLNPRETVFIDDSIQHIEGAKRANLLTYHLTNGEKITDLFL